MTPPQISVMPERFLALTRGAGLPIASGSATIPSSPPPVPTPASVNAVPPAVPVVPTPASPTEQPRAVGLHRSLRIGLIIAAVVLVGGGIVAVVVLRSLPSPQAPPSVQPPATPPSPVVPPAPPIPTPIVNVPPPPPENIAPPPAPATDRDTDNDALTDAEEAILGTDPQVADTDADGYSDGVEVANLYNPTGIAPQRLRDAGLASPYVHPIEGWSILIPRRWVIAATDQTQRELRITTPVLGEVIVMRSEDRASVDHGEVNFDDVFPTKGGIIGYRRGGVQDATYAFPVSPTRTLVFTHAADDLPRRFPNLFHMVLRSFAIPSR
jgi:hypothetical protein